MNTSAIVGNTRPVVTAPVKQRRQPAVQTEPLKFTGKNGDKTRASQRLLAGIAGLATALGTFFPSITNATPSLNGVKSTATRTIGKTTTVKPQNNTVSFPLQGTFVMTTLLGAYGLDLDQTRLPESKQTLREFLRRYKINPDTVLLTIDPNESVNTRLTRWNFDPANLMTVDSQAKFKRLILATFESFFRLNREGVPTAALPPGTTEDRFFNELFRESLAHDVYLESMTLGTPKALPDGSILFETGLAPDETGNGRLLRSIDTFLSHLDLVWLDSLDQVLNGEEQKVKAAFVFDQAAGTHYAGAVDRFSPNPKAVISSAALQGPFLNPFSESGQDTLAARIGTSFANFMRSNVVFHALMVGGSTPAANNAPTALHSFIQQTAQGALSTTPLPPFAFGFIEQRFPQKAKDQIQGDLTVINNTGTDPILEGTAGPGGYLDQVFFDSYGVSSQQLRANGKLQ